MFKVEFYVDDKRLAPALKALVGIAMAQPSVLPVVNAKMANGHVKSEGSGANMLELFATFLKKTKKENLIGKDVDDFLRSIGRSKSSRAYLLKQAASAKLLKKSGKSSNTVYIPNKG